MPTLEYLRSFTVFNYAIFDLLITFLGMWLASPVLSAMFVNFNVKIPRISWLFWALPLGIIFHLLFRVSTPMTSQFIDLNGFYLLKTVIIALVISGFRGVKLQNPKAL